MSVLLYTDVEWDQLLMLEDPVQNQHGEQSFSIHCDSVQKIQLGEYDEPTKCHIVRTYGSYHNSRIPRGCRFQCSNNVRAWLRELENQVLMTLQKNSESWFGTSLQETDLRKMFKPLVTPDGSAILRCEQNMQVYSMNKNCGCEKGTGSTGYRRNKLALPIMQIKGIWIEKAIRPMVSMTDLLQSESIPDNPFCKEELHEDAFADRPPSPVGSVFTISQGSSLHGEISSQK